MGNSFDIDYEPSGKALTGKTWADYDQGLSPEKRVGWEVKSDLSRQLWTMDGHSHLRYQEWRLLLSAAMDGLPVVVTWDTRVHIGRPVIERATRTIVVRYLTAPSLSDPKGLPVRIHAAYSGSAHVIRATEIREVAPVPAPPVEFIEIDENTTTTV